MLSTVDRIQKIWLKVNDQKQRRCSAGEHALSMAKMWAMAEYMVDEVESFTALVKRGNGAPKDVGPLIGQLFGMIQQENPDLESAGPPYVFYLKWAEAEVEIEAAIPVNSTAQGRGEHKVYPACRAVVREVTGPYEGLAHAWSEMWQYIRETGFVPCANGLCWDCYLTGPMEESDPQNYVTEIAVAVDLSF